MMRYRTNGRNYYKILNTKSIFLIGVTLSLLFSLTPIKADWEDDANARIEANRKRDVQITVKDLGGAPINNVDVQIEQVRHNFGFGAALAYGLLYNNSNYRDFVLDHFEWAVCENEMKWISNESTRDVETYSQSDYIANWCANNDIILRGHCLFWEQDNAQMPTWVLGPPPLACNTYPATSEMMDEMEERMDSIVNRYKGQIVNWDVDNEMLSDDEFACIGETGRAHMFQYANSIDPNCGMYMNEYWGNSFGGCDGDEYAARANGLIALGAPVEGLGIQAHINTSSFDPANYYNNLLNELDDLGLPIIATEFDTDATGTQAADDLEDFYRVCFSHPNVEAIMMWGIEQSAWRWDGIVNSSTWVLTQAGVRYETLLDEWTTNTSDTTEPNGIVNFRGFHGTYEITLTVPGKPEEVFVIELEPGTGTAEFVFGGPPDTTPPTPDPAEWASVPAAAGSTSITMTAAIASDVSSPVYYYFECTTDGSASSTWRTNPTYVAQGLTPSTPYTFHVKARDNSPAQNETGWSGTATAAPDPPDTTPPSPSTMAWFSVPTATGPSTITMTATTATDADSPPVEYYFECTTDSDANSTWQTSTTYEAQGLDPGTLYTFRVKARDSATVPNENNWSTSESATTDVGTGQTPYPGPGLHPIPGTIEAENYDDDGPGVAYNDTTSGNEGGDYRSDDVDVEVCGEGNYNVGWIFDGEWLEYSVIVATTGTYDIEVRVASDSGGGDFHIEFGGSNVTGTVSFSATGGWQTYTSIFINDVSLTAGAQIMRLYAESDYWNITWLDFTTTADITPPANPTGLTATADDGFVDLDWNDNGEGDLDGYNVYRSTTSGVYTTPLNSSLLSSSDYTDNSVVNGTTYYYVVKAVDTSSNESGSSNEELAIPDIYQNCTEVQAGGHGLVSDLTDDCYIDLWDLDIIVEYWLDTNCGTSGNCEGADFEPTDGDVDLEDFSDFAVDWMLCNNPGDSGCIKNWLP